MAPAIGNVNLLYYRGITGWPVALYRSAAETLSQIRTVRSPDAVMTREPSVLKRAEPIAWLQGETQHREL